MATLTYTVTVASGTNAFGTANKFFINGEVSPVLFLQEETNAQGEDVFRVRPSPFDLQGGLPSEYKI